MKLYDMIEVMKLDSFSKKIRYLREVNGLTQGKLAKLSDVSVAEICRIESGERQNPSVNLTNKLLVALNVSSEDYADVLGYSG